MVKLICFDMDGVVFEPTNFWIELHKVLGTLEEGQALTEKYLYTDYDKLVQEVVERLWKGKDAKKYFELVKTIPYYNGTKETFAELKRNDYLIAIISSGSIDLARRAQHDLGVDFIYANELVIKDNIITGEFVWPLRNGKEKKAQIVEHLCQDLGISAEEVVYIGDSESDSEVFKIVGKAIAFNSDSQDLKNSATHIIDKKDLREILPILNE